MKAYRKILLVVILFWQTTFLIGQNNHVKVIKTITREVDGKMVELRLDGKFELKSRNPIDNSYYYAVDEKSPGIIFYQKLFFEPNFEQTIPIYDQLEFFDKDYNPKKVFDIKANNPFLQTKNKSIQVNEHFSGDAEYLEYLPKSYQTGEEVVDELNINTHVEFKVGFSTIFYSVDSISGAAIIGKGARMIILDSIGNSIFTHDCSEPAGIPVISKNGRYVMFAINTIETISNVGVKIQQEGFEIWDTKTNSQIYSERNSDPNMWISMPIMDDIPSDLLRIRYSYPNSANISGKHYIFYPDTRTLYSKILSKAEIDEVGANWFTKYKENFRNVVKEYSFNKKRL